MIYPAGQPGSGQSLQTAPPVTPQMNYGLQHRYYVGSPYFPTKGLGQDSSAGPGLAPTGSVLQYVGTWQITLHQVDPSQELVTSDTQILQQVSQNLPGLQIIQQKTTFSTMQSYIGLAQNFQVTLTLQVTGPGFSSPQDAKSIVDHAYYLATGTMPVNSAITLQSATWTPPSQLPTTQPQPQPQPQPTGSTSWLASIWPTSTPSLVSGPSDTVLMVALILGIVLLLPRPR